MEAPRTGWFSKPGWTKAHYFTGKKNDTEKGMRDAPSIGHSWCRRTWFQEGAVEDCVKSRCQRCKFRSRGL